MERTFTIRFSQIDGAGIVFYPRYFEMLSELFADLPIAQAPFAMQTNFLKPNYLGDKLRIVFVQNKSRLKPLPRENEWFFAGYMDDRKHFSIRSLPSAESELGANAHLPDLPAFESDEILVAPWLTDCTSYLQVSRFFELINVAVEQWFPKALGINFHELHTVHSGGIPTVVMRTRCRELPRAGETVSLWIRPTKIGEKSLGYTTWLLRDGVCLLENEQVIVFVRLTGRGFETISIPDGVRQRLQEQYVAT